MNVHALLAPWSRYLLLASCVTLMTACATDEDTIASRYVLTLDVAAEHGATIELTEEESILLAGTMLRIPPGSLERDILLTVEIPPDDVIADPNEPIGPVIKLGPDRTALTLGAELTLPFALSPDRARESIYLQGRDEAGAEVASLAPDPTPAEGDEIATGTIPMLASYQVGFDPTLLPPPFEVCNDGTDNDNDGLIDCADSDCASFPLCAMACMTTNLGTMLGDGLATGSNAAESDDYAGTCGTPGGRDVAFLWEAPGPGCYIFDTSDSDYDTVLRLYDTCNGTEQACDDDSGVGLSAEIQRNMSAGDTVVVVIDGWTANNVGNYSLDINVLGGALCPEQVCSNGIDDDNDGLVDCADPDCSTDPACVEALCSDGVDNDNDGLIDCSDPDCSNDPACGETSCNDGIDNDADGLVDCDDPECSTFPGCFEAVCNDGIDNDNDGLIDCTDSDCVADPSCGSACTAANLGTMLGAVVATGSTVGAGDDFNGACGAPGALDVAYAWEAPSDGCFEFDTTGSDFDTLLRLYDSCGGTELACADDGGGFLFAVMQHPLSAGDTVVIVVDAFSSNSSGNYTLGISSLGATCP